MRKIFSSVKLWLAFNLLLFAIIMSIELSEIPKSYWWNDAIPLITSILAGGLVSFFFYWLVVYVPEQRKRAVLKGNLSKMYQRIKLDILYQIIFASKKGGRHDLQADQNTLEYLLTFKGFKETFSNGREANEGFYAFENQMSDDTPEFQVIVQNIEFLARQIEFVLHNYTMEDENLFDHFKRVELMLLRLRNSSPGYDESKPLCSFIYQMFSGWDPIEGYRDYDVIDNMIAAI